MAEMAKCDRYVWNAYDMQKAGTNQSRLAFVREPDHLKALKALKDENERLEGDAKMWRMCKDLASDEDKSLVQALTGQLEGLDKLYYSLQGEAQKINNDREYLASFTDIKNSIRLICNRLSSVLS
jgi:hypothetical protein